MQPPFHISHGALSVSSQEPCGLHFLVVGPTRAYGGAKDGDEVVFDGGEAVWVVDWGVSGLVRYLSNAS